MNIKRAALIGAALLSVSVLMPQVQNAAAAPAAQTHKRVTIHRLFTGPDGQTHVEEIEALGPDGGTNMYKLMANSGATINRAPPGRVADWHTAPRRQYVITLSGRGQVELNDGTKIDLGPGSIDLAEDLTGKGHITRVIGNEDRITISIPLSDH
jgi:mannose-6-phosphate isomerase-like protein (cupin superfamily)